MCGIAGFWQVKRGDEDPADILRRMHAALIHRGPDDSGIFHDAKSGVGLAFARLAILDLSPSGHQPMDSASGRYTIVFNGEVYNFEDIRAELGAGRWRSHSDTEVMLEAIERWGLDAAVQRFAGMFAFALWDRQERSLCLVRDRLGIKPLYYGRVGADFVFASELKAIRQYPDFAGEIDRDALALYTQFACVPQAHCIYRGLHKLPAGHYLVLRHGDAEPELRQYWSAADAARRGVQNPFTGSDEEAVAELERQLLSAVRLRMIADVPLGAFLSGGIDSSTVVALMQAQSTRPVKTFTIGFHEAAYNEAAHAKNVATHLGTDHTELYLTPQDALNVVPLLPAMYDEPFADESQIPTYLVSKLARGSVTVSLSGDGGDELFGGYNRYVFTRKLWNAMKMSPRSFRGAVGKWLGGIAPRHIDRVFEGLGGLLPRSMRLSNPGDKIQKLAAFLEAGSPAEIYLQSLSQWRHPAELVLQASGPEPATVRDSIAAATWLPNVEESMMLTDLVNYLPDDILTKVDRASMAVSLEARVPILDHRVVEFAWRLPLHMKIRGGVSKWILRQVLYRHVPQELLERPKMGFSLPVDAWLRGPLRDWAESLLAPKRLRENALLDANAVGRKWQEHVSGARNWQYQLWVVLVFQDWYERTSHSSRHAKPSEPLPVC